MTDEGQQPAATPRARKAAPVAPVNAPWLPIDWGDKLVEVHALRALHAGTATAEQQSAALKFIIEELCRTYDLSYRPGAAEDTAFAEGKRFVGLQLVKLLSIRLGKGKPTEQGV